MVYISSQSQEKPSLVQRSLKPSSATEVTSRQSFTNSLRGISWARTFFVFSVNLSLGSPLSSKQKG